MLSASQMHPANFPWNHHKVWTIPWSLIPRIHQVLTTRPCPDLETYKQAVDRWIDAALQNNSRTPALWNAPSWPQIWREIILTCLYKRHRLSCVCWCVYGQYNDQHHMHHVAYHLIIKTRLLPYGLYRFSPFFALPLVQSLSFWTNDSVVTGT